MNSKLQIKRPELVSPAGNWSSLKSAVKAGCDSVYFGVKGINMRSAADNFEINEISKIMDYLRTHGKKGYLALNVIVYDKETKKVERILETARKYGVNAVILWDMAVFSMAKAMGLNIHLSTQASVANFESLKFFDKMGVKRIVLARECALSDIKRIIKAEKKENIKCQIESFVHGAMCVSVSGRCFLSQMSFSKSANRGECLQPCRREFKITDVDDQSQYVIGKDYVLSPTDLCSIMFVDKLMDAGISAFKIEGRMRSPEYVKEVTLVYREAIDAALEKKLSDKMKKELFKRLKNVFNRGFSDGFYFSVPEDLGSKVGEKGEKRFLGEVVKYYKKIGVAEIKIMTADLLIGEKLLIYGDNTPAEFFINEEMQVEHKTIKKAKKGTMVGMKVPSRVRPKDKVFSWKDIN